MLPRASALRRHPKALAAVAAAFALLLALGLLLAYARGGGPLPAPLRFLAPGRSLASGSAEEVALRTLRLAGYDHAIVGEGQGTAVVRLAVPSVASPADVELSWQTALAVAAEAYPRARTCVAQVFSGSQALLEVRAAAEDVRGAGKGDDLRSVVRIVYLSEGGGGS